MAKQLLSSLALSLWLLLLAMANVATAGDAEKQKLEKQKRRRQEQAARGNLRVNLAPHSGGPQTTILSHDDEENECKEKDEAYL